MLSERRLQGPSRARPLILFNYDPETIITAVAINIDDLNCFAINLQFV